MGIIAVNGAIGNGKSYYQLRYTLKFAEQKNLAIVTNRPDIDLNRVYNYCIRMQFYKVASRIDKGEWVLEEDFQRLMYYRNAIIMADELGIYMNSRAGVGQAWEVNRRFFEGLIMSRHANLHMCWVSQEMDMVDKNIRRLTEQYWHCLNTDPTDTKKSPQRFLIATMFLHKGYEMFLEARNLKTWNKHRIAVKVMRFDPELMACYNTLVQVTGHEVFDVSEVVAALRARGQLPVSDGELAGTRRLPLVVPKGLSLTEVCEWKPKEAATIAAALPDMTWTNSLQMATS